MTHDTATGGHSPVVRVSSEVGATHGEELVSTAREAADTVSVVQTGPTGVGSVVVAATLDGRTAFRREPSASALVGVVETLEDGRLPTEDDGVEWVVEHDPAVESLPAPETGPLSVGRRSVLGPCGWVDPLDAASWSFVSRGDDVARKLERVAELGLRGRGRGDAAADEPVGATWETAREADGDAVVVVNANEAEARARTDRTLLAGAPMAVLDGAAAVAAAVDATDVVLYVNESEGALVDHLGRAREAASETLPTVPQLVAGPDAYRAGAPTAALEALEGAARVEPRLQPPPPAEHGLYGRPTVIHTPRTVAQVRHAVREPETFDADAADPGTRLVSVTGDVASPATVELAPRASLAAVRDAVSTTAPFELACVGGVFGGLTPELDVEPTALSLRAAGLGTDGVVELLGEHRCPVATAGERAAFAARENSGRCVPGREGTKQLTELVRDVYAGSFESDAIRELARVMRRSANCRLGSEAPRPVTTAIDAFEPEFRAHAAGRCSSGACTEHLR